MVQNQSSMSVNFLKKWLDNLDYINDSMRSVRKVQNDCEMMTMCVKNPDIVNQEYSGVIFDKIIRNNGVFTYMVYIEKLKLFTKLTTDDILIEKEKVVVRLYVYMYECNSNKRVRVEVV
jgi:hypothetical protein